MRTGESVSLRRGEDFRPRKWPVAHASFGRTKGLGHVGLLTVRLGPFGALGITPVLVSSVLREVHPRAIADCDFVGVYMIMI